MKLSDVNLHSFGHSIAMSGVIYEGEGKTYLIYFPGGESQSALTSLDLDMSDWEAFLRQTDTLETEVLTKTPEGTIVKAFVRKCERNISQEVSWTVFRRDGYKCRYCANAKTPLTVDHLVLWELGGPSIEKNLLSACKKCNKTRGNTSYVEWLNDPYYLKVSKGLDQTTLQANAAVVSTLDSMPITYHKRSR